MWSGPYIEVKMQIITRGFPNWTVDCYCSMSSTFYGSHVPNRIMIKKLYICRSQGASCHRESCVWRPHLHRSGRLLEGLFALTVAPWELGQALCWAGVAALWQGRLLWLTPGDQRTQARFFTLILLKVIISALHSRRLQLKQAIPTGRSVTRTVHVI